MEIMGTLIIRVGVTVEHTCMGKRSKYVTLATYGCYHEEVQEILEDFKRSNRHLFPESGDKILQWKWQALPDSGYF